MFGLSYVKSLIFIVLGSNFFREIININFYDNCVHYDGCGCELIFTFAHKCNCEQYGK